MLIIGLIAFYAVSIVTEAVEDTGLASNWSSAEIILILRILPAAIVFGTMASVFLGVKRKIGERFPPDE